MWTIMWLFRNLWRKCGVKRRVTVLHRDCVFLACFLAQGEQSDHGPKSVSRQLIGQACWLQALLSYCWHNWKQLLFQKYSSCWNCLSKKYEILLDAASAGIMYISLQQLKWERKGIHFLFTVLHNYFGFNSKQEKAKLLKKILKRPLVHAILSVLY